MVLPFLRLPFRGVCVLGDRLYSCSSKHYQVGVYKLQEEMPLPVVRRFGVDCLRPPTGLAAHAPLAARLVARRRTSRSRR